MNNPTRSGQIITFYSYKGGTGRSMAVANLASYLARRARVLVIDWDLDAPGLHYYFGTASGQQTGLRAGLLEFFEECRNLPTTDQKNPRLLPLRKYILETAISNLHFLKAGKFDVTYSERVRKFDWEALHEKSPNLIETFAKTLQEGFDYVLIDSRTGLSDISAICTAMMPEKLVVVFTPNSQNIEGALGVVQSAIEYRKQSNDTRPLMIFPLPSRIEVLERKLLDDWRFSKPTANSPGRGYQPAFESLMSVSYDQPVDLSSYFDQVQIQHAPQYSYGEQIAVLEERVDRLSLATSYIDFAEILAGYDAPWEVSPKREGPDRFSFTEQVYPVDEQWIEKQEIAATNGLSSTLNTSAYTEFTASLLTSRPNKDQGALLDAARFSQIKAFGWPIGFVADQRPEFSPRPTAEGIVAEIPVTESMFGPSYDYWSLRKNGDFFILQSYFEDSIKKDKLFFDTRITRLVETLLYCSRLYKRLNVNEKARVRFVCKFTGLKNRELASSNPSRPFMARSTIENEIRSEAVVSLESVPLELLAIVKDLLDPLFIVFNFMKFSDPVYSQIVDGFLQDVRREGPSRFREGFTVDFQGLRLFAEQATEGKWIGKVYDLGQRLTVYETEAPDVETAKSHVTAAALLNIYGPKHDKSPTNAAAELQWKQYTLPTA